MSTWLLLITLLQATFSLDPQDAEVQRWVSFLKGERFLQTRDGLMRSTHYVPRFKKIFRDADVPEDLVWIALIESSFRYTPTSPTQAQGMFQFKEDTARAFGLRVDAQLDERDDANKAAMIAAQYLRYLYEKFLDWELVVAAYNLGEGDLRRTMAARNVTDWPGVRPFVREETQNFVEKVKAAALVGNAFMDSGERFELERQLTHVVRKGETLYSISRQYGVSIETLQLLNELKDNTIKIGQILLVPNS